MLNSMTIASKAIVIETIILFNAPHDFLIVRGSLYHLVQTIA